MTSGQRAVVLLVLLLSSSCLIEKRGTGALLGPGAGLEADCAELSAIGTVEELTSELNGDISQLLGLTPGEDQRANELVGNLTAKVQSLQQSTTPQFTTAKWDTDLSWSFGPGDLALLGSSCDLAEKRFTGAEVEDVYIDGAERNDLVSKVITQWGGQAATFELKLTQTSLSLCELQNVTGLKVKLSFVACGQADWREYRLDLDNFLDWKGE